MVKKLEQDITTSISDVIAARFKKIQDRFKINLGAVFGKSLDRALQVGIDFGGKKVNKQVIKRRASAVQKVMANDISNIKNEQTQNVSRVIAQSYAQGLPSLKTKQMVVDQLGQSNYKIQRAVRTNSAYLGSLTKLMTWDEMGFKEYEWVLGKSDKATRPLHRAMNGKPFKIKDALAGRAPIPGRVPNKDGTINLSQSINCRCGIRLGKK